MKEGFTLSKPELTIPVNIKGEKQIADLEEEVRDLKWELAGARDEASNLRSEMQRLGATDLKKLRQEQQELFNGFVKLNNISLSDDGVKKYRENIESGLQTARQAVMSFKKEFPEKLDPEAFSFFGNEGTSGQMKEMSASTEILAAALVQVVDLLKDMSTTIKTLDFSKVKTGARAVKEITEELAKTPIDPMSQMPSKSASDYSAAMQSSLNSSLKDYGISLSKSLQGDIRSQPAISEEADGQLRFVENLELESKKASESVNMITSSLGELHSAVAAFKENQNAEMTPIDLAKAEADTIAIAQSLDGAIDTNDLSIYSDFVNYLQQAGQAAEKVAVAEDKIGDSFESNGLTVYGEFEEYLKRTEAAASATADTINEDLEPAMKSVIDMGNAPPGGGGGDGGGIFGDGGDGELDELKITERQMQRLGEIAMDISHVDWENSDFIRGLDQSSEEFAKMVEWGETLQQMLSELSISRDEVGGVTDVLGEDNERIDAEYFQQIADGYKAYASARKAAQDIGKDTGNTDKQLEKEAQAALKTAEGYRNLEVAIAQYTAKNRTMMSSDVYQKFQQLQSAVQAGTISLQEAQSQFKSLKASVESTASPLDRFIKQFKSHFFTQFSTKVITAGFMELKKAIRDVFQNVIELDKAITDLQIATGYSREQTAALVKEYSQLGNKIGATTLEVAQAADEWLRQGYSAEEASRLIESSMMLSKLGQISASEATTALTSAINGYKMSAEDAVSIVDKLTAVDMEAAASAGGLATSMSKTATSAMTAGVSMDTLIGYIAKVKEVTQDGDEAVGTFFKTMLARMGNIKSGLLVDPETDEDLSDVESALSGVGIKLRDTSNHFRDLESVLNEVSQQWGNYSNVQQRAIAKAFAGTRQQEKFLVLMENYDDAMRLAGVAANSSGTAIQKYNDAYLKSYEAAKNSLSASTEAFSQSVLDTDIVIGAVNALNMLVQALTKLNETGAVGWFTAAAAGLVVFTKRAHDLVNAFNTIQGTVSPVIASVRGLSAGQDGFADSVTKISNAIAGQNKVIQDNVISLTAKTNKEAALAVVAQLNAASEEKITADTLTHNAAIGATILGLDKEQAELLESIVVKNADAIATGKLTEAELAEMIVTGKIAEGSLAEQLAHMLCAGAKKTEDVATQHLTKSQIALNAAGGPTTLILLAIAGAVVGLVYAFKKLSSAESEARADLEDMRSDLNATENEISSITSELEQNKTRLEELNDVEHPTYATEAEIAKLEETNQKLETQLALLKARAKYQNNQIDKQEEKVWEKANSHTVGSTVWYDDGGGKVAKPFQWIADEEMYSHFLSTADAVDVYIQKMNDAQSALDQYQQEALKDGEINDDEQKKIDELSKEVQRYTGDLLTMSDILGDAGDKGQEFVDKIAYATTDAAGRWGMMKNDLDEVRKRIDANDLKGLDEDNIGERLDSKQIQSYAQAIKNAGSENELFNSITKDMTDEQIILWFADLTGAADDYKDSVDKATDKNYDFADSLQAIGNAQSGFKSIKKAFDDINSDGKVSFDTISDISAALKDVGVDDSDIEKYTGTLLKAKKNSAEFKQTLSDMTYVYARNKIGIDNLVGADEKLIARQLDGIGVSNSAAVAHQLVAEAEAKVAMQAALASGDVNGFISALSSEAGQAAITEQSFVDLVAEMIVFNSTNLDVSQKISALNSLIFAAYGAENAINAALGGDGQAVIQAAADQEYARWRQSNPVPSDVKNGDFRTSSVYKQFQDQATLDAYNYALEKAAKKASKNQPQFTPTGGNTGGGSSSGGGGGGGSSTSALDNYTKSVDNKQKKLELSYKRGEMSAKDYFKALEIIYKEGYDGLKKAIENGEFSDSDEEELLDAETGMLDKLQGAHRDSYEEEKKLQDHYLKMNYITEEQYFAELTRLYLTYYAGREEYSEEAQQAEEELYEKGTAIVEKWANAAVDAVNAVSSAMQSMASAATDLLQGLIDANEHSFDRYYKNLQHQLKMNYITEAEYTDQLDKLYKRYFKDRYIYLDQYQQYEEEVYQAEQQALQDAASATEDIHGKVVDMIRDELEEQKDAIDETKDAYLELIDIRRQALEDQKDQEDYEKEHAEKLAAVAELQRQLNALANDNSAEGVRKYKETLNSLHDAQEELYDFEREHAYDSLEKQLDEQEAALENSSETTKTEIDKKLEDNEWLVAEAWRRMQGMSDELYNQLIAHNKKYSTSIKDDITDAWDKAREAMQRYYDGVNAEGGYAHITGRIGESGMTDAEAMQDNVTAGIKNVAEYTSVFVKAIAAFASAGASLVSSFASILNQVFPNPLTSVLATGAGGMASAVSGFGGMATNLFGFIGGLAGGSDSVSATGIYRTDEFGEELKMLRTADGNYTMLTKGSKVFTARATERLAKILEHPELLTGGLVPDIVSSISGSMAPAPSMVDASSQNITLSQSFNISGANPDEIANKIKGTIADYTLDVIRKNSRDSGRVRPVRSVY